MDLKQSLHQSIEAYKKACKAYKEFQQLRSTLTSLEAQLMKASSNDVLARTFKEQEAAFQQHPLYQQGAQLAINGQKLRDEALEKATPSLVELGAIEMRVGLSAEKLQQYAFYKQEAQAIREDFLQTCTGGNSKGHLRQQD